MPAPDLSAISSLLTSLKVSTDLAKAALGLRDSELVRAKAVELTAEIFTARESALATQAAQSALLQEIDDLKRKLREMEDWSREKERYQLAEVAAGVFAYVTKPEMEAGEPPHKICANCYSDGRKAILQRVRPGGSYLCCHACKAELRTEPLPPRKPRSIIRSGRV